MDQLVGQCYLTLTPPLYNTLIKSITKGVHMSCGSVQWAVPLEINTPCVKGIICLTCTGGVLILSVLAQFEESPLTPVVRDSYMRLEGDLHFRIWGLVRAFAGTHHACHFDG